MISFTEAYNIVMSYVRCTGKEQVDISDSLNRVLAQDVASDIDMPPFNKSAMDGYACRSEDLSSDLNVLEIVQAGYVPQKTVGPYECSKIMTGAMVPEGADCVIIVEETEEIDSGKVRLSVSNPVKPDKKPNFFQRRKGNICFRGEDIKLGETVLQAGQSKQYYKEAQTNSYCKK